MRPMALRLSSSILCLTLFAVVGGASRAVWFEKHVAWQAGKEPRVWEMRINRPKGNGSYRLALIPLWKFSSGHALVFSLFLPPIPELQLTVFPTGQPR
jgi:hypothetical protein